MPSYQNAQTGGKIDYSSSPAGTYKRGTITERVTGAGASPYLTLTQQAPAGSRVLLCTLNNRNTITPRMASTAAATNGQLGIAIVSTAPTALAAQTTSNYQCGMIQTAFGGSISSNAQVFGAVAPAATNGLFLPTTQGLAGTSTTPLTFYVVPYASTTGATDGTQRYLANTATATNGNTLNGTGTVTTGTTTSDFDVQIVFEYLDILPNA